MPLLLRAEEVTSVWRVEGGNAPMAVAGSIHVLPAEAYPLPKAFMQAYDQAQVVVFELLMEEMFQPAALRRMQEAMAVPDEGGEEAPAVRERLRQALEASGLPVEAFEGMANWAVVQQLALFELQRHGISPGYGVDLYFTNLAKRDGKTRRGLETLDQQLGYLEHMGKSGDDFLLRTLDELPRAREEFELLMQAWRRGDRDEVAARMRGYFQNAPDLDDVLLRQRNREWMVTLEELLRGDQPVLMVVGVGHLCGSENVLQLLEERGYRVTPWR